MTFDKYASDIDKYDVLVLTIANHMQGKKKMKNRKKTFFFLFLNMQPNLSMSDAIALGKCNLPFGLINQPVTVEKGSPKEGFPQSRCKMVIVTQEWRMADLFSVWNVSEITTNQHLP